MNTFLAAATSAFLFIAPFTGSAGLRSTALIVAALALAVAWRTQAAPFAPRIPVGFAATFSAWALLAVASAKIRTADAAREGALIAHQVHGAIGVTNEYALHHVTLRLWAWREEFGNEAHWAMRLARRTQQQGADAFWATLTAA